MSNKKQSSIDWLEKQLYSGRELSTIIQQAKAMHKEEIEDAYEEGYNRVVKILEDATKRNETFGGNNE